MSIFDIFKRNPIPARLPIPEYKVDTKYEVSEDTPPPLQTPRSEDTNTDTPIWIVNHHGELGVEINGRCYFLYKGESVEYDDPIQRYRKVTKREFGECCISKEYFCETFHEGDWSFIVTKGT